MAQSFFTNPFSQPLLNQGRGASYLTNSLTNLLFPVNRGTQQYNYPIGPNQGGGILGIPGTQPGQAVPSSRGGTTARPSTPPTVASGGRPLGGAVTPKVDNTFSEEQKYINEAYQPSLDFLSTQQNTLQNQYGQNQAYYQDFFNPQYQQLDAARQAALALNSQNQQQARQQTQSAIDLASNTYQELQRQNQQLYGGASSAGQFGNELQGRELQRNIGTATGIEAQNIAILQNQLGDIESNYQSQRTGIDQQKNQALVQLQQAFEQSLLAIDQQRASLTGSKATDKYNALKEFNAHKQAVLEQSEQLKQQLGVQALGAQQQIQSALLQYQAQQGQTPNLQNIPGMEYSRYLPQVSPDTGELMTVTPAKKKRVTA